MRASRPVTVSGTTSAAVAGYKPLPDLAMTAPVNAYRAWVKAALPHLLAGARTLDADVARGDLTAARADWLTAHLGYERLGAAYNSFGDFDDAIDGTADGRPLGVGSPDWTGFFSIEYGLWHGRSAARLRPLTQGLVRDVAGLVRDFPSEDTDPGDLPLRSHEILENALEFQLTGTADYGSGTTLATVGANIAGTREVVGVLEPLIRPRDPALLAAIGQDLARTGSDVAACRTPGGGWTPLHRLSDGQRQRIDGDLGQLLEELSSVPDLLAPRTFRMTTRPAARPGHRTARPAHVPARRDDRCRRCRRVRRRHAGRPRRPPPPASGRRIAFEGAAPGRYHHPAAGRRQLRGVQRHRAGPGGAAADCSAP